MTIEEVFKELKAYGNEGTKNVLMRHGAKEPFFGVKVQDLKKIVKRIKKNYSLSLELYESGNSDAMYLAGLIAEPKLMSKEDLQNWVNGAYWYMISGYTVPWVAAESDFGYELALEWIESYEEMVAAAGWATLSNLVVLKSDESLDINKLEQLLVRVEKNIHEAKNRVRYNMNGFVIAIGVSVVPLTDIAISVANNIGKVHVEMGGTSCKVPFAPDYIKKVINRDGLGKKRKKARC